jgi:hypothetical protein
LVRIDVEARGDAGTIVGSGTYTAPGPAPKLGLEWSAGAETLRLHVVGTDANGFRAALDLSPWSYAIPHEDVVFASDQATIGEAEGPKLERAYGEIQKVLARFGDVAEVKLFVAGYTDTVGTAATTPPCPTLAHGRSRRGSANAASPARSDTKGSAKARSRSRRPTASTSPRTAAPSTSSPPTCRRGRATSPGATGSPFADGLPG